MRYIWRILERFLRGTLVRVTFSICLVIIGAAILVYLFEHTVNRSQFRSVGDAIWWSIVTMTTVGYGDKIPVSTAGRAIAVFIMFGGVGLISILTATVSSIFVTRILKENKGLKQIRFKDHIVICGWNYNTEDIIRTFSKHTTEQMEIVLVNELPPERVESLLHEFPNLTLKYVHGDFTKESALHLANIGAASSAIILPDISTGVAQQTDDRTLLATLAIKSLNPNVKVYAHIVNRSNFPHLKRARADEVIVSDEHIGFFIANHILYPGAPQVVHDLLDDEHGQYVLRVHIPKEFIGKSYEELLTFFKREKNWTLIGLVREEEKVQVRDVLSHDYSALDTFIERKFEEAGFDLRGKSNVRTNLNPPVQHVIEARDFAIVIAPLQD